MICNKCIKAWPLGIYVFLLVYPETLLIFNKVWTDNNDWIWKILGQRWHGLTEVSMIHTIKLCWHMDFLLRPPGITPEYIKTFYTPRAGFKGSWAEEGVKPISELRRKLPRKQFFSDSTNQNTNTVTLLYFHFHLLRRKCPFLTNDKSKLDAVFIKLNCVIAVLAVAILINCY